MLPSEAKRLKRKARRARAREKLAGGISKENDKEDDDVDDKDERLACKSRCARPPNQPSAGPS